MPSVCPSGVPDLCPVSADRSAVFKLLCALPALARVPAQGVPWGDVLLWERGAGARGGAVLPAHRRGGRHPRGRQHRHHRRARAQVLRQRPRRHRARLRQGQCGGTAAPGAAPGSARGCRARWQHRLLLGFKRGRAVTLWTLEQRD